MRSKRVTAVLFRTRRRAIGAMLARACAASLALALAAPARFAYGQPPARALARPDSLVDLLARGARERKPIVALFSQLGCPYCEAIRREQLLALAGEQDARGVIVVEFDVADAKAFVPPRRSDAQAASAQRPSAAASLAWASAQSPEALARALQIRLAPTVLFIGPGGEVAERLVGYTSRDFYGAYLDNRIDGARAAIAAR